MSKKHRLKIEDVRKMTDEELSVELTAQRGRLFTARSQSVTEKVEDLSQFGEYKRNIARLLTEQGARRSKGTPAAAAGATPAPGRKPAARTRKPAAKPVTK